MTPLFAPQFLRIKCPNGKLESKGFKKPKQKTATITTPANGFSIKKLRGYFKLKTGVNPLFRLSIGQGLSSFMQHSSHFNGLIQDTRTSFYMTFL